MRGANCFVGDVKRFCQVGAGRLLSFFGCVFAVGSVVALPDERGHTF